MSRLLPKPLHSVGIVALWLILNQTLDVAQVGVGLVLALVLKHAFAAVSGPGGRLGRPALVLRLSARLLEDVVRSNFEVARRILGPESAIRSRFVWVPVAVKDTRARYALAAMITMTPGTLSVDFSPDGRWLLVHVFHAGDEESLRRDIRERYEAPLAEIFS